MNKYTYCNLVNITVDAYSSCLNHALLTESEEVMGLLLGNVKYSNNDSLIINIFSTICLTRKCKAKDRVEFDEIQVSQASEIADVLSKENRTEVNVVGWYHSHPKITIPPSQVDLNTQYSQQYQGPFVGLIFSCFNTDNSNTNKIKLTAFQAKRQDSQFYPCYVDIEFVAEDDLLPDVKYNTANSATTFCNILRNLVQEEEEQWYKESSKIDDDDYLNRSILFCNRQILYSKMIQIVSTPYVASVCSEIENLKNLIDYTKNMNFKLKDAINNYEDIYKFKDD
jgi:proteasome lid subunit RPN8/RPN11